MAKRTKQAVRKAKALKTAAKKSKQSKKQTTKGSLKIKAKRQETGAQLERSGAKKSASRRRRLPTQQETTKPEMMVVETQQTETTIVDVIEEPIPGVFVVTEIVETTAERGPTHSLNIDQTVGPESEER